MPTQTAKFTAQTNAADLQWHLENPERIIEWVENNDLQNPHWDSGRVWAYDLLTPIAPDFDVLLSKGVWSDLVLAPGKGELIIKLKNKETLLALSKGLFLRGIAAKEVLTIFLFEHQTRGWQIFDPALVGVQSKESWLTISNSFSSFNNSLVPYYWMRKVHPASPVKSLVQMGSMEMQLCIRSL